MTVQWEDISSFGRGETDRTPKTFEAVLPHLRIVVTRHVHYAPTDWIVRCRGIDLEMKVGDGSAEEAKDAAIAIITERLRETLRAIDGSTE